MPHGGVLGDLVTRAKDRAKEVVLMVRQCGHWERPPARARALRALLNNPNFRVFSRLVLDQATATELLK